MEEGIDQGRREDLKGGGLIRKVGGWSELKQLKMQGHGHEMSDERILADSGFVENLLSQADSDRNLLIYQRLFLKGSFNQSSRTQVN